MQKNRVGASFQGKQFDLFIFVFILQWSDDENTTTLMVRLFIQSFLTAGVVLFIYS